MSHFLRQLNILSSLKGGSDNGKIIPIHKILAPILTYDPSIRQMHTKVLSGNLKLKVAKNKPENQKEKKKLAIVLAWMLAKGNHVDRYCKMYINRGFDVLTVQITPLQLLFPTTGTQVVVTNLLEYLNTNKQYENIVIHAFSVSGYVMGEVFTKLKATGEKYDDFTKRVAGIILDSAVDFEGIPTGFPRAIASNQVTYKALHWYIKKHLAVMHNVATKHYLEASKNFHNTPLTCPALFLVSQCDKVGTPESNMRLANNWNSKGVDITFKCWKNSGHVSHLHHHEADYIREIDNFLGKLTYNHQKSNA